MKRLSLLYIYAGITTAVLLIDRITKFWALHYCTIIKRYNSFIACELSFNRGASWGILNDGSTTSFLLVSTLIGVVTAGLMVYAYKRYKSGYFIGGELLIVAGSLSNILDRFFYKGVIDFIELSYRGYYWPSFNVADACIVTGVGILVVLQVYNE